MTDYLYVKKWDEFQHYKKRNPPWIKLHRRLLNDHDFLRLSELEQWQLVRIWMLSAEEEPGGWLPNDPRWIKSMIRTERPVALKKFVAQGWLCVQDEASFANARASTVLAKTPQISGPLLANTPEIEPPEVLEVLEKHTKAVLPSNNEFLLERLADYIGDHGDDGTPFVLRRAAEGLSEASMAQVLFSARQQAPVNRAAYVVGALKKERAERQEVA